MVSRYLLILFFCVFSSHIQGKSFELKNIISSESDSDGDGVPDHKDFCPDLAGLKSNKGCPEGITPPKKEYIQDRDRDGIENPFDSCPDIPGEEKDQGCPPAPDMSIYRLKLNATVASLQPNTIPSFKTLEIINEPDAKNPYRDADHDGVRNREDRCPMTKGLKSLQGCPELTLSDNEILTSIREDLIFERGNANLVPSGRSALESLAVLLTVPYPESTVTFSIYADELIFQEDNANLTYERGKKIKQFLSEQGVETNRLRFQYFGDMRPPASYSWNPNERSRVEIILYFP
ncbi:MAG: thrombospondin type 3 repeat-containing protein [Bacteroidia bacterium]|nr:thrombospondin type 3 repeat-containing protein [Bacteroidia bacterium]